MSEISTLLLVDADLDNLAWMKKHLSSPQVKVLCTDKADKALAALNKHNFDLLIADLDLQPYGALELLQRANVQDKNLGVILIGSRVGSSAIIEAMQRGALDVLKKESLPFELKLLVEQSLQAIEHRRKISLQQPTPSKNSSRDKIVGNSRKMQEVFKLIGKVSRTKTPVLISGESGSGKEIIARAIHEHSPLTKRELITINCAAIPENLIESELFGHEKGAFTGALSRREGRFEQANGGTLFLDEIGDMPASVQVKLLRVLQDGSFCRVGSNETILSDARIIAATHKDLRREVELGNFREDLYYRLNVVSIHVPALRERPEDIPLLAEYFLKRTIARYQLPALRLSGEAIGEMQQYPWPGNVRELENTIYRACSLAHSPILLPQDIQLGMGLGSNPQGIHAAASQLLEHFSHDLQAITDFLKSCHNGENSAGNSAS